MAKDVERELREVEAPKAVDAPREKEEYRDADGLVALPPDQAPPDDLRPGEIWDPTRPINKALRPGGYGAGKVGRPWDSETAKLARKRRFEKASKAIRDGVEAAAKQLPDINKNTAYEVIKHAAEQHALNATDPSATGSASSLKLLLDKGWPEPKREEEWPAPAGDEGAQRLLLAAFKQALANSPELRERLERLASDQDGRA